MARERIKIVYTSDQLRVEYDWNCGEFRWLVTPGEDWVPERVAVAAALAMVQFTVKGML